MTEIVKLFEEVVAKVSEGLEIISPITQKTLRNVRVNYLFGSSQYIKDSLDLYSKAESGYEMKFPLIALFTPIEEDRGGERYFSQSKVNIIIACSSDKELSNEQREMESFRNVLRPIYRRLLEVLRDDPRLDFGYGDRIRHGYSENYDYGRYGAYTDSGDEVSEPIDAINIRSLEINVKHQTCR